MELPSWIDRETWDGYLEMRRKIRKPATERAMKLAINELARLREQGNDANAVLDQSTLNSWQGLFALRQKTNSDTGSAWLQFREAIRNEKTPEGPIGQVLSKLGGVRRLGGFSSWDLDKLRADFDAAFRQVTAH